MRCGNIAVGMDFLLQINARFDHQLSASKSAEREVHVKQQFQKNAEQTVLGVFRNSRC